MKVHAEEVKLKKVSEEGSSKGVFTIGPLPSGFGNTIGNSLRRTLLTSIQGAAITQVKFSGVPHQFTTIKGVKEDVTELCLNLKRLRLKVHGDAPVVLKLSKVGPCDVKASDFEVTSDTKIKNPSLHIATLADKNSKLELEAVAEVGTGYVASYERETSKIGVILLDSAFSPVTSVSYVVEPTRVGRETNLDKLTLTVETDGTVPPLEAVTTASEILKGFFSKISLGEEEEVKAVVEEKDETGTKEKKEDVVIEELPLPTRTVNALKKAGIKTLSDLAKRMPDDLADVKNLGEKSIDEIKKLLEKE